MSDGADLLILLDASVRLFTRALTCAVTQRLHGFSDIRARARNQAKNEEINQHGNHFIPPV